MNIFASYPCPAKSAIARDDQRLVKMVLESCQLLSTAAAVHGVWRSGFAKPTHTMHPCLLWVCEGRDNWDWLWEHVTAMDAERRRRWGSAVHKTLASCTAAGIVRTRRFVPVGRTPHVNCARNREVGVDFTWVSDVHKAYRLYLSARWALQSKPAVCKIPIANNTFMAHAKSSRSLSKGR